MRRSSATTEHRTCCRRMQTRQELYDTISYQEFEALDASIARTIVPQGMPQR